MNTYSPYSRKSHYFKNHLLHSISAGSRTIAISLLVGASAASGQSVPSLMNYQGKLVDAPGNPMPNGSYDIVFKISMKANSADPADGLVWGQTNTVTVVNGIFNTVIGGASGVIGSASKTNLVDAFAVDAVVTEVERRVTAFRPPLPLAPLVDGRADAGTYVEVGIP